MLLLIKILPGLKIIEETKCSSALSLTICYARNNQFFSLANLIKHPNCCCFALQPLKFENTDSLQSSPVVV